MFLLSFKHVNSECNRYVHRAKPLPISNLKEIISVNSANKTFCFYYWTPWPLNICISLYASLFDIIEYKRASSWENVSSGVSDQVRLKLACSATEASMRLEILVTETRDITLSRQRTTKALIRLRGCAGWSAPLLFAYDIKHVFSWPGSKQ